MPGFWQQSCQIASSLPARLRTKSHVLGNTSRSCASGHIWNQTSRYPTAFVVLVGLEDCRLFKCRSHAVKECPALRFCCPGGYLADEVTPFADRAGLLLDQIHEDSAAMLIDEFFEWSLVVQEIGESAQVSGESLRDGDCCGSGDPLDATVFCDRVHMDILVASGP